VSQDTGLDEVGRVVVEMSLGVDWATGQGGFHDEIPNMSGWLLQSEERKKRN
jgi:hypothetical protein